MALPTNGATPGGFNQPTAHAVAAASGAVGNWNIPVAAHSVRVYQRGTAEVFITVDGSTPAAGSDNQWYLPGVAGAYTDISITEAPQGEVVQGGEVGPNLQAVCATAALSLYVVVND